MKRILITFVLFMASFGFAFGQQRVAADPMNALIYTLDNGLKVYLSVNKDEPRIQTYIAVRVGSKNDPSESTGLSHYLEHLMFKGTTHFGTMNWEAEKPYIQKIEELYEVYNHTTDVQKRVAIYHQIDSMSYEASRFAIPNEYDKMMSLIGSQETNAFTSNDFTMYQENIPSNQIENWAKIQADRFQHPVFRIFHTELEAVYEEKNMSLTNDSRKVSEEMMKALFPHHPYGLQTTLGTTEHLKNPSLTNIGKHFTNYYVPNNYAIVMSGDFDPDQALAIIKKYFGAIPMKQVPTFTFPKEEAITQVKNVDVVGLEAENVTVAFRVDKGTGSKEVMMMNLIDAVMSNGSCGLIDVNVNQKQLCQSAGTSVYDLNDYSAFMLRATPKQGQTLEGARDILLNQLKIFKSGAWDESLLTAAINNWKLQKVKALESNTSRAMEMAYSYVNNRQWSDVVNEINEMSKFTKQQLVDFANQYFKDNNYVVINKRQGTPKEVEKIVKPPITPIIMNRDVESDFFKEIKSTSVTPIEPVFVDYSKDLQHSSLKKGAEILYVPNKENKRFSLSFRYNYGLAVNKKASLLNSFSDKIYSKYLSLQELNRQLYNIACEVNFSVSEDMAEVTISGLSENMPKALAIVEGVLKNPKIDAKTVENEVQTIIKRRNDAKAKQNTCFSALINYARYGKEEALKYTLSNDQLKATTPKDITTLMKDMLSTPQTVIYYGDMSIGNLKTLLDKGHFQIKQSSADMKQLPVRDIKPINENTVFFTQYNAKQSYARQLSTGDAFNNNLTPSVTLYNEYFGGSMNSIVFQELREKRSLAYSAAAYYVQPSQKSLRCMNFSHIATQNDKLIDAMNTFNDLFDNMPVTTQNFNLAKESIISSIRTNRTLKEGIIYSYLSDKKLGRTENINKVLFESIPTMTIDDVIAFNHKYIKDKPKTYVVLGNKNEVNMDALKKFGAFKELSLEEIFGY